MFSVFIVDDEWFGIVDLQKTIQWERFNFEIKATFTDSRAALESILIFKPDVVFTDIKMPHLSGLDIIDRCRDADYGGEFVIVSGYDDFQYAKQALQYKVFDYCLKPLNEDETSAMLLRLKKKLEADGHSDSEGSNNTLIRKIEDYIEINLNKKLSIRAVSEQFHVSPSYCAKLFSANYNKSFVTYVTERRIIFAKQLLLTTGLSVNEISQKAGFDDYFYFAKRFKAITGQTPSQFRADNGKGHGV